MAATSTSGGGRSTVSRDRATSELMKSSVGRAPFQPRSKGTSSIAAYLEHLFENLTLIWAGTPDLTEDLTKRLGT